MAFTSVRSESPTSKPPTALSTQSYAEFVIGAAIFDLSGLPKEYLVSSDSSDAGWVQTIFQALGLQSLLTSSLKLESFRYGIVHGKDTRAIVLRQRTCYIALLIRPSLRSISKDFVRWAQEFELAHLKADPRFSLV
jgi:hypothetical protein